MFQIMREDIASAGDGPAILENNVVPATTRLRAALAACESLLGDCTGVAGDRGETSAARMLAAGTAAKLAAASALAASAIAKLADAETHQRLATTKIELSLMPRRPARRPARHHVPAPAPEYDASDWRAYPPDEEEDSESEKPANNRGPRIWSP